MGPAACASRFPLYVNPRSFLRRREVLDDDDQPSSKRPRLDLDCPWLKELHSKIQDCLNQKCPDRDTEEYDGTTHDVLSDKLDVLKWTQKLTPMRIE